MNNYEFVRGQTPLIFMQGGEVVVELNTLPLSSRAVEKVFEDHAIEFACQAS